MHKWGIQVHDKAAIRWVTDENRNPVSFKYRREAEAEAESMNKIIKRDLWKVAKLQN